MRIAAYSKVPAATPFIHLGYLAASTTVIKPIQSLLLSGLLLLLAGLSVARRRSMRHRASSPAAHVTGLRTPKFGLIGSAMLILGVAVVGTAFVFGERQTRYLLPKELTSMRVTLLVQDIAASRKPNRENAPPLVLPTQEGEYDALATLGLAPRIDDGLRDAWNTPLKLRVIQTGDGLKYVVASAGPDRKMGTRDDITSDGKR